MMERKQEKPFDPERAARLDDPARFAYLPVEDILALLAPPQGATLLDFGTGTATYALAIAELRPDLRVVAYDVQPAMLDLARAKPEFAQRALEAASTEDLPRLRGTIDRAVAINVLHEIDDVDLVALRGLMKPDGRALIVDWDAEADRDVGPSKDHSYTLPEAVVRVGGFFTVERSGRFPNHFALLVKNLPD
jgi:ubiquinone/menaquinone biosynthesis C-methylase UbiE